ncbi:hypothetical protein IZ6_02180 [Terrihabitans soli]|uniref:DUF2794 domain-containing protein n=1 Tax=Terrihabitans soli TaxID=708113 RepID=A0A6S6QEE1_9HYPH|nr:DUF2794 domain-containing protein [Terrihabitans soli]BCJ89483.1 hypothetical protein IZ6_02180 [Terrihabitans soli]
MGEVVEPIKRFRGANAAPSDFKSPPPPPPTQHIAFDRHELREILNVYGRLVASGEMRDYAIDMLKEKAVFSLFRRMGEVPTYRVEKDPKLRNRQGAYAVITATGLILKRGHDLARVLSVLDKRLKLVTN